MKTFRKLLLIVSIMIMGTACRKQENPAAITPGNAHKTDPYPFVTPKFFPFPEFAANNPLTVQGVELGRHLYYDSDLSSGGPNAGKSCSSCHFQSAGFALPGSPVLPHVNLAWNSNFLWNGKISGKMEDIMVFEVHDFFQSDLSAIKAKPIYKTLYKNAFGNEEINELNTAYALSQFIQTLVSANSSFDRYIRREILVDSQIIRGFQIFNSEKGDCFHCHILPTFSDNQFHNIGLDSIWQDGQKGRYEVSGNLSDLGKFKTANLRNSELRKSYMHDGRFKTLEEVVEHYNSGVRKSAWLDPIMTKAGKETGLNLTSSEKADLVAFLKSLTDETFINNPAHSNPW